MSLKLNKQFVHFFQNRADGVSNFEFEIRFRKFKNDKHVTYEQHFHELNMIMKYFDWLKIEEIILPISYELLLSKDNNDKVLYDINKYSDWSYNILKKYNHIDLNIADFMDNSLVYRYNILINDNELLFESPGTQLESAIYIGYNPTIMKKTQITFGIELRKELFLEFPWGKDDPYNLEFNNFYLTKDEVKYNREVLENSIYELIDLGYILLNDPFYIV